MSNGKEIPRIRVVLASAITKEECSNMNLDYQDPSSIALEEYEDRQDEGILVVREAGEQLWKLMPIGS
jgi:hypothetical protein